MPGAGANLAGGVTANFGAAASGPSNYYPPPALTGGRERDEADAEPDAGPGHLMPRVTLPRNPKWTMLAASLGAQRSP
jgi:hypothetical protein